MKRNTNTVIQWKDIWPDVLVVTVVLKVVYQVRGNRFDTTRLRPWAIRGRTLVLCAAENNWKELITLLAKKIRTLEVRTFYFGRFRTLDLVIRVNFVQRIPILCWNSKFTPTKHELQWNNTWENDSLTASRKDLPPTQIHRRENNKYYEAMSSLVSTTVRSIKPGIK